ncbi:MAG: hypothetical protein ACLPXT_10415 [Terracidiphilus sp.]
MNIRNLLAASLFCGIALTLSAQQSVAPPPKPVNDAPANAAILKLLQVGMPESVVLDKIRAITDKFDTSIDALVTLKQAGATEAELKAILAQDSAPAQPADAPADSGPSLAETMQFIQEKLNNHGNVAFLATLQDTSSESNGSTWNQTVQDEISNVVADPVQCRISYHWKTTNQGSPYWEKRIPTTRDENDVFSLRDVQEIVLKPFEQCRNELYAKRGSSAIVLSTNPPMMVLVVRHPHGVDNDFHFTDADLANRIAKAMLHAVELCGGGGKEPF